MKELNKSTHRFAAAAVATISIILCGNAAAAGPTVNGNVISWTEPGWHQVQVQSTGESVCGGGRNCTVPNGVYKVINHGTGDRFEYIVVPNNDDDTNNVPAPVAATGQVISYAFGDDGDYQNGVVVSGNRFTDNGDGTFTDSLTGIVWLSIVECIEKRNWAGAVDYANNFAAQSELCPLLTDGSVAGDWRLPNVKELYSLVDASNNTPAWADGIPYTVVNWADDPYELYWSSTSFTPANDVNAWVVNAGFGQVSVNGKSNVEWVWPIRDAK